jgi:multicomponent Na+:H+ antiporter subunit B
VSPSVRRAVFLVAAAGTGALLTWGLAGLHPFGHYPGPYGLVLNRVAVHERHATEVVGAVTFDYRGVDTMGEEFILFAAVIGATLLLRVGRDEVEEPADRAERRLSPQPADAVRLMGLGFVGPTVLLGLYVVAHGYITPGGGFQGGVVLASASVLVFLAGRYVAFRRVNPIPLIDLAEGLGAGLYPMIGVIALAAGGAFLSNTLPLGHTGDLRAAGTIPFINLGVGLEVAAGFVLILSEYLEQTLAIHAKGGR